MLGATALGRQVRAGGCIGSILNAKSYDAPLRYYELAAKPTQARMRPDQR